MKDIPPIQRIATETLSALADLKRQRESLDAQIAALEEIAHIQEEAFRKHGIDMHEHAIPSFNQQGAPSRGPREGSKRHRICEAAAEFLADGQPKHRMDIAKHLRQRGLIDENPNEIGRVSHYLSSTKDRFVSHGSGHWALKPQYANAAE